MADQFKQRDRPIIELNGRVLGNGYMTITQTLFTEHKYTD
jgi:hypothetical protein